MEIKRTENAITAMHRHGETVLASLHSGRLYVASKLNGYYAEEMDVVGNYDTALRMIEACVAEISAALSEEESAEAKALALFARLGDHFVA